MCRHVQFVASQTSLWCRKPHVLYIKLCMVLLISNTGKICHQNFLVAKQNLEKKAKVLCVKTKAEMGSR